MGKISFGKYKGKQIGELPLDYLSWIYDQRWFLSKSVALRKAIAERIGKPVPLREKVVSEEVKQIARPKSILEKQMDRDLMFDDFYERRK